MQDAVGVGTFWLRRLVVASSLAALLCCSDEVSSPPAGAPLANAASRREPLEELLRELADSPSRDVDRVLSSHLSRPALLESRFELREMAASGISAIVAGRRDHRSKRLRVLFAVWQSDVPENRRLRVLSELRSLAGRALDPFLWEIAEGTQSANTFGVALAHLTDRGMSRNADLDRLRKLIPKTQVLRRGLLSIVSALGEADHEAGPALFEAVLLGKLAQGGATSFEAAAGYLSRSTRVGSKEGVVSLLTTIRARVSSPIARVACLRALWEITEDADWHREILSFATHHDSFVRSRVVMHLQDEPDRKALREFLNDPEPGLRDLATQILWNLPTKR